MKVKMLSLVWLFATPRTVACTRLLHPWEKARVPEWVPISFLPLIGRGSLQLWLRLLTWDDSVSWWALNTITCILVRRRGRLDIRREDDVKVMAGLETCSQRSRSITSYEKLEEEQVLPNSFRGGVVGGACWPLEFCPWNWLLNFWPPWL